MELNIFYELFIKKMNDPFEFDPNSTENEGRWRLIDPKKFEEGGKGWFRKNNPNYPGISYVFGRLKEDAIAGKAGDTVKQTIRFKKSGPDRWSEKEASKWWEEHKDGYDREWTQKDWDRWIKEKENDGKRGKIPRKKAIDLSKNIIARLGYEYVAQKDVTIDYRFKKGVAFPVGSIRRGKEMVGDIDILLTAPIDKERVREIMGDKITGLVGKDKKIDFDYHYHTRKQPDAGKHIVRVNLFVTLRKDTFGAALIHHSGPYEYNIYIRKKVKSFGEGWKLSQNGLIDGDGDIIPTPTERALQEEIGVTVRKASERKN
jgi:hypothetical protein